MATPSTDAPGRDLTGRVALVTGAGGGGGGSEIVRHLRAAGARVYANGLERHAPALGELAAAGDPDVVPLVGDVSDAGEVDRMLAELLDREGRIDVAVHNAATSTPRRPVGELSLDQWRTDLATILDGAFHVARSSAPAMAEQGWGRIVLVSSSAAFRGARGRSAGYSAAKAGLHGLVAHLALELGPAGITVNAVAPSQIDSPRVRRGGRRDDASLAAHAAGIPLRRVGEPADLAALVTFLASPASGYLTGQILRLDGGSALAAATTDVRKATS